MAAKETPQKRVHKSQGKSVVAPASTLVRKRNVLVPLLIVVLVVVAAAAVFFLARSAPRGDILATVNGEPIYQEDIDEQYKQLPEEYRTQANSQYTKEYILNQTIDRTLLLQEAEKRELTVTEEEIDAQLKVITDQYGITEGELYDLLKAQNVSIERYRGMVREELLLNKVVQDAVLSRVTVIDSELVEYYESHETEFTAPPGGAVISHILVENESTALVVISKLGNGESFDQLAQQYSIDGSGAEGGYLGIVNNETPFVEEFKSAALLLREGQYTRKPVQTMFGYHVIFRGPDKEPFRLVRDKIQSKLKLEKQVAAFQTFLSGLRSEAKIKYYTNQGIKSTTEQVQGLDAFAQCVGEKATVYGTTWSEFFNQQKDLFGESFQYLTYVDCDEKPHLCSAANIQKYPTWVIKDTDEHTGKLSLQEIADKTRCDLPN